MENSQHMLRNKKGRMVIEPKIFNIKSDIKLPARPTDFNKPRISIRSQVMKALHFRTAQ